MPFQMRDETAGVNVLYIDNNGWMGLGSLPNAYHWLTVGGVSVLDTDNFFGDGMLVPGSPRSTSGSVTLGALSGISLSINATGIPHVTSSLPPTAVTSTNVDFYNSSGSTITIYYSIW